MLIKGAMMASSGGDVPGAPVVGGDDPQNDTVKALLSPGEIVIPRSITQSADAPERAARFVAAVQAHHAKGKANYDTGGPVFPDPFSTNKLDSNIQNGGQLVTNQFDQNRDQNGQLQQLLAQGAAGKGPSMVGQQLQNATDSNIQQAMGAGAQMQGPGRNAALAQIMGGTNSNQMGAAGMAANAKLGEQMGAQGAQGALINQQRAQDLAMAKAKQQAAMGITDINAGLTLDQQAQMRGLVSGVGGAAVNGAMASGAGPAPDMSGITSMTNANAAAFGPPQGAPSSPSDWSNPFGAAHGGEVPDRTKEFLKAVKKRKMVA
jgi:hypothetical protein